MANLLVVDDEPSVRRTFALILERDGHSVRVAEDGASALSMLASEPADVVISDIVMPDGDGITLLERVVTGWPRTRVVLVTGEPSVDTAAQAVRAGAHDYLSKPVSGEALRKVVGHALQVQELDDENRRLQEDLAIANRELEAFAYSVSHDLRAPLRAIDGFGAALVEDFPESLPETALTYLDRIRVNTRRMYALIDDLLEFSRSGRAELDRTQVDLSQIVRSHLSGLQRGEPNRTVELDIAEQVVATGDHSLLRQVLANLLDNAWKYSSNEPVMHIAFGVRSSDAGPVYYVRDNGVGFDMAHADRIFMAFERLHSVAEFEGSGVGLATVHRIVRRHGGSVWAEAAPGEGATFFFTLADAAE